MYCFSKSGKKYTSGPRYWNVPVLVNTGTFYVYQYCLKMWYLRSLECAGGIQKQTILECQNGLVLSNTRVPVSGTWSILFPVRRLTTRVFLFHTELLKILCDTNLPTCIWEVSHDWIDNCVDKMRNLTLLRCNEYTPNFESCTGMKRVM